ncbi:MAG: ABC transporter permease [Planctomycetota bacterium]
MSATPWKLARKHLLEHWVRSGLTMAALTVAFFLLCFLISIVTTINSAVKQSSGSRLIVQSAVSLFVQLPRDYQAKVASVPGVKSVSKFQWFGGYYREISNFFAQFAVDQDIFFNMYRKDFEIKEGPNGETGPAARPAALAALAADRRACIVGERLLEDFGWKIGDTIPLMGTIYQKRDRTAWEFKIIGSYRPLKTNVDDRTIFFRYDYLQEFLDNDQATGPDDIGVFNVTVEDGFDPPAVIAGIDRLFENGPQKTLTSTEAAFQAGFVSMLGNLPFFVGTIGGAVVFAVLFSVINTMMMAGRQRAHEAGILKALGFRDGALARLMLAESMLLSLAGGALGIGLALVTQAPLRIALGPRFPNYHGAPGTLAVAIATAALIGLIAGIAPSLMTLRLKPTEALRSEG